MHKIQKNVQGGIAAIAVGCGVILSSAAPDFSTSAAQAQSAVDASVSRSGEQRPWDGFVSLLQAMQARAIAHVLEKEQKSENTDRAPTSVPIPMCVFEHGLCGAVNKDGSVAVHPRFDWVGSFHEGRALVRVNGLYGYVDVAGHLIIKPQYVLAGDYSHGFAEVDIGGKSAIVDLEGHIALEPKFTRALPFGTSAFWVKDGVRHSLNQPGFDELVTVHGPASLTTQFSTEGTWKLVNRTGTLISTPEISSIQYFDPNEDNLMWAHASLGWGLIKIDGTWLVQPTYEEVRSVASGRAAVRLAGKWGYIDPIGVTTIAPRFQQASRFSNGLAAVQFADQWGYIDRTGSMIIEPQFSGAEAFDENGLALAKVGKLWGLIDRSGAWVIPPHYDRLSRNRAGIVWVEVDGKIGAFEASGKIIASPQFSQTPVICDDGWVIGYVDGKQRIIRNLNKPLDKSYDKLVGVGCSEPFRIQDGSKFGFVDRMLRPITEIKFDSAKLFSEKFAVVNLSGRYGYIKEDGQWLTEPSFDDAQPFRSGAAVVSLDGKLGYIKADGSWLAKPQFDEAQPFESGFAIAKRDGKNGLIDASGAWLGEIRLYSLSRDLGNGLVPAKSAGKWGFIDAGGGLAIEQKYDEVRSFRRGISWVKFGGSWCAIDRAGRSVPSLSCQTSAVAPTLPYHTWPY